MGMDAGGALVVALSQAANKLRKCESIDDYLRVGAEAEGLRAAVKKAGLGLDAYNFAAEIKLRSEREVGELVEKMFPHGGDRKSRSRDVTLKMSDAGISKMRALRCRHIAASPSEVFDEWLRKTHEAGKELTTAAAIKLGRQAATPPPEDDEPEPIHVYSEECHKVTQLSELGDKKFGTIYADPPWKYGNQSTRASTDNHYSTMSVDELCDMPVADYAADDAHLHLWTTNAFLPEAFRVITAWGFEYRSCYVWVKPQMGIGNYWRVSHEFLLLGIRGKAKRFLNHSQPSWGQFDRTKHSAKPEEIRQIIEYVSPGPFLEMFGRRLAPGWTVLGNQIERTIFDAAS